jgi:hypothetical protein
MGDGAAAPVYSREGGGAPNDIPSLSYMKSEAG